MSGYSDHGADHAAVYPVLTAGKVSRDRVTGSLSRDTSEDRKYLQMPLTPSDTSIDDSVKSGNLMKYLSHKPSPGRGVTSDSDHTSGPGDNVETVEAALTSPPPLPGYHHHHASSSGRSRPSSGYNQFFHPHSHVPSPRYSSPPPLLPQHSGLGSPLQRQAAHDDRGLYPPLEPPASLTSISPTPANMFHQSAGSPCLDMFGVKSRGVMPPTHAPYGPMTQNVFTSLG